MNKPCIERVEKIDYVIQSVYDIQTALPKKKKNTYISKKHT